MSLTSESRGRRNPLFLGALAAGAVSLALYSMTFDFGLVWDDSLILERLRVTAARDGPAGILLGEFETGIGRGALRYFRPLTSLTMWGDSLLAPLLPASFHLTNIFLNALAAAAAFLLLSRLLPPRAALLGGLLFAVHPAHAESVCFVSGRTDILAGLFAFLSAWLWLKDEDRKRIRCRILSLGALFLAALSKETALMLPLVLVLWGRIRSEGWGTWWRGQRVWLAGWGGVLAASLALRWSALGGAGWSPGAVESRALLLSGLDHLRLLVWPLGHSLFLPADRLAFSPVLLAGSLGFLAFCLGMGGRGRKEGFQALAWSLLFLLPSLASLQLNGSAVAERFLYLPSLGLALVAGSLLGALAGPGRTHRPALVLAGVLMGFLAAGALARSGLWESEGALYARMEKRVTEDSSAVKRVAVELCRLERFREAAVLFEQVLDREPSCVESRYNLGMAYARLGRWEEAARASREVIRLDPSMAEAHFNLGVACNLLGRELESVGAYREAIRVNPGYAKARFNLGMLLARLRHWEEAQAQCRALHALDPPRAVRLQRVLEMAMKAKELKAESPGV